MDGQENMDKNEKYVADYSRYLKAKYFSDKTLFGGNVPDATAGRKILLISFHTALQTTPVLFTKPTASRGSHSCVYKTEANTLNQLQSRVYNWNSMASTTSNSGVHSESASSRSPPPVKEEQDVSSKTVVTEELKKESVKKPKQPYQVYVCL
ncbi:hypothetical protein M9H77_28888 [Catharanthus roseus]|uniref:Uncharacterized protein n=1 Tax=Catharanthus roseus TaxID=4058 RepID=A0ACC0AIK6_CATRO|nr:hypothetical protein M9H77_28888 [Catharanthus roseus]